MKHALSFPAKDIELYADDIRHQLYLITMAQGFPDSARRIKSAKKVIIKPYICMDDCSGHYKQVKIDVYTED